MSSPPKTDPAIYQQLRQRALQIRLPGHSQNDIQAVLMDWHIRDATATVLAAADGTASIYLSSGGGFIGGSQASTSIRDSALEAVRIANLHRDSAAPTDDTSLPPIGTVFFYLLTNDGLLLASAPESALQTRTSPFATLGYAMQHVVAEYRRWDEQRRATA